MEHPRLTWQKITLQLRNPFGLSYGVTRTRDAFWLRLAGDEGWGEGTIPQYYGVAPEAMTDFWESAGRRREPFPDEADAVADWLGPGGPAPARCALDLALHDRIARRIGLELYELLGLPEPRPLATSYTIGMDAPSEMARLAGEASKFPILKIKLGSDGDLERFEAVRSARPDAVLFVDANSGWSREVAVRNIGAMESLGLELVEQPVAGDDIEGMGIVQSQVGVPVVADESMKTLADLEALADGGVSAVNVKLMKLGGLVPALRVIHRARERGLRIMLGCMVETSLGVTAMAHLSGLAEWLDLDAPFLIKNDPFEGVRYDEGARIEMPGRPGIGVRIRGHD